MTGIRPRGYAPLLGAAAARAGIHQIDPAEDHRRRHRLALLRPAQTQAEDISAKGRELPMPTIYTGRRLLKTLSAAAAAITGMPRVLTAGEALETTTVRIVDDGTICIAPLFAAEELLRAEGFTDVRYPKIAAGAQIDEGLARGAADFGVFVPFEHMPALDVGAPITVLAGVHVGCFELFAHQGINKITDLKGKTVGLHASPISLLTLMAAQVGLDPAKDIEWVTSADPNERPLEQFADGKLDAFLGFPPEPQELRARRAGHVILNTATDRPWSQYFCCMLAGNREYVRKHPIATKRVLRAVLKATDLCVTEPSRVARRIFDGGFHCPVRLCTRDPE